MKLGKKQKQPSELKDYPIDYTDWLAEIVGGDTIDSAITTVACITDATDTALVVNRTVVSANAVSVWLQAGTSGQTYKVTVKVTTVGGRVDESELTIKVKDE